MKFVIAGAAGLGFVSTGLITQAQAQEGTPSDAAAPHQAPAPSGTQEGAPAGGESHGATTNAAEVEHTEHGIFPPFNSATYASQLFWLVIIFGAFYVFLQRVVLPQVGGIIETREARIKQDLDQAGRLKTEADSAMAAYEQALAEARARAGGIGQEARDKAKADAEAERKRVEGDLDAKLSEAQSRIDGIKASAMGEVGTIASDTAEAIVQALTGGQADRQAVDAAVSSVRS